MDRICSCCGRVIENDELYHFVEDDNIVCQECLDDNYVFCEVCNNFVRSYNANWIERDDCYVCDDCLYEGTVYSRCDCCNDIVRTCDLTEVHTSSINANRTEEWCGFCFDNNAYYCSDCGEYFADSAFNIDEDCCVFCSQSNQPYRSIDNWIAPRCIKNYSYKPAPCFLPMYDNDSIYFGFELEMEYHGSDGYCHNVEDDAVALNDMLGFTYAKHDSSLGDTGVEIVSHPATFDWLMQNKDRISSALQEMRNRKYTSHDNKRCGLHFHISLKPMLERNDNAVNNLLILVDNMWDELVKFSRRTESQLDRWAQRYCVSSWRKKDNGLWKTAKDGQGRYMAVNLQNPHTVEIRMMRGTLRAETFFATLQLIERLVEISIVTKNADSVTWEDVIDCEYEELRKYASERVRNIPTAEVLDGQICLTFEEMRIRNLIHKSVISLGRTATVISILPDHESCIIAVNGAREIVNVDEVCRIGAPVEGDYVTFDDHTLFRRVVCEIISIDDDGFATVKVFKINGFEYKETADTNTILLSKCNII